MRRLAIGLSIGAIVLILGAVARPYLAWAADIPPTELGAAAATQPVTNSLGMKFVTIPAGEFLMGFAPGEPGYSADQPQRKVRITRAFRMQTTPVTQKQFAVFIKGNTSAYKGDNQPVERVSWLEAVQYCKMLSEKEGKTYRLPTEAEWEYACRAGTTTWYYFGNTISTKLANYDGTFVFGDSVKSVFRGKTTDVGSFPPNPWGLFDMCGNVWQWCSDWDGDYPKGDAVDPTGPADGTQKVMRGGSYNNEPGECRSASRDWYDIDGQRDNRGFRMVMEIEGK